MIEILPYAEIHRHMNTRKHSLLRAMSSNIHFLGHCTLMAREQVMSDQQVTGTPWNLLPALRVCYYQIVTSCVQSETLNSWQVMHHSEMKRGLFFLVNSRPSCRKACGQLNLWDMVAWASSVFRIPQSWQAQVNYAVLLSLSLFSPSHTSQRNLPHKPGAPSASFFHWLAWLPWQQARPELPTDTPSTWWCGPTVTSQISIFWLVRLCKHFR
jgi:hypothetical protein